MANLPIMISQSKDLTLMQTKWASQINPLLTNPLLTGTLIKDISLTSGDNQINHLQGQPLNGYIIVGMSGAYADIYEKPSPNPNLFLILNASGATTISLYVF